MWGSGAGYGRGVVVAEVRGGECSMDEGERSRRAEAGRGAAEELLARQVSGVVLTWVDTGGITRAKAVPCGRLEHAAAWGVGMSPAFDFCMLDDSILKGPFSAGPVGDLRLHPDLDRLAVLAALPGWAWAPADRYDLDGRPHPRDGRGQARRAVERLGADGFTVRAAFEVEWSLSLGHGDEFVPACGGPAYGMTPFMEQADYLRDVLDALTATGVSVDQIHPEYAAGQFEVSVAATDPLAAADTFVLVRETIRAISHRHGMRASFAPMVTTDGVGNGAHVHLSLWRDGRNLMSGGDGGYGLTPTGESFAAGILSRLPALLAIGAPSAASYLRLIPFHWAGAFACWGWENREAALRFVPGASGDGARAANFEIKSFDATANPYLLMAALLAAGQTGLAEKAVLPAPVDINPAKLEPSRSVPALPSSLEEAVQALESDDALAEALGEPMITAITVVRRGEAALFDSCTNEEIVARTRWRH
ncbi:glutamine synthetase family protein [Actinomadura rupiterrae]|uniref:glutamine synthetase family protein n=1 Tax=Actinomadura rupiterrae TaxID=559627 RepID=UPI0020A389AF|nr:glutamine synthetase family protein [Actinomadura rupiterrae]MCP2342801.1 glutamine synthetase [Actinomadura rupiterrae]